MITLGIIGVVAAMTIPTLYTKIQDQIFKTRWKKAYSDINQAFKLLYSDDDIDVDSYFDCTEYYCSNPLLVAIFEKYKHTAKTKETTGPNMGIERHVATRYQSIDGKQWPYEPILHAGIMAKDMTLFYWTFGPGGGSIWVDVNGYQNKPNVVGRDLFAVQVRDYKVEPMVYNVYEKCNVNKPDNLRDVQLFSGALKYYKGIGCSAKYIYEK